jgi:hypothetical protein
MKVVKLRTVNNRDGSSLRWSQLGKPWQNFLRYRGITPFMYNNLRKTHYELKFIIQEESDKITRISEYMPDHDTLKEIKEFCPPYDGKVD